MGSNQSSSAKAILNDANNLYENSSSACIATCTSIVNRPTTVVSNTSVGGNINIQAQCNASASCVMQSTLDSSVENIMSSLSQQENVTTQLLPIAFDFNNKNTSSTISQQITNNITQNIQSICQATNTTLVNNPTTVFSNDKIGGSINIGTNQGSASANCTINNLSRIRLFNQSTSRNAATTSQSNVFGTIMIAIVIIIVIGAIILVIIIGPMGVAAIMGHGKKGKNGEGSELAALEGLDGENGEGEGGKLSSLENLDEGSDGGGGIMSSLSSLTSEGGSAAEELGEV